MKIKGKKKKKKTQIPKEKDVVVKSKKKSKGKKERRKWWKILLTVCIIGFIACILAVFSFFLYIVVTTGEFDPNALANKDRSIIYDSDGNEFATLGMENRESVTYDKLPDVFVDALIATEDSRFFQHNGVDVARFTKAAFLQVLGNSSAGGASTLTMQVVKNNLTSTERTGIQGIIRKFRDVYLAVFFMEKKYTKEEIIEYYVNDSALGGGCYGVEEASKYYFGKSVSDLNLAEASMIAGLFQAPNGYNPYRNPEGATKRRSTVLKLMVRHGYITQKEADIANSISIESLLVGESNNDSKYQSYIDTVIDEVEEKTGESPYNVPMKIYTNMKTSIQDGISNIMSGNTDDYTWKDDYVQAGVTVVDVKTGAIAAIGGGRNRKGARTLNYATQTYRQPGSTAKPIFAYGPGFEYNNFSTYELFNDEAWSYTGGINVNNWDGGYQGLITLKQAVAVSRNVPAVKAFQQVGAKNVVKFVQSLGINLKDTAYESYAIGGLDKGVTTLQMAGAYAAFANGGYYHTPHSFTKFVYRNTDETVENKVSTKKAMSTQTAYMMTSILKDTAKSYPYISYVGGEVAAKTGTTNFDAQTMRRYKMSYNAVNDLWVAGYNPNYAIALWYGYPELTGYADNGYYNILSSTQNHRLWAAIANKMFSKNATFKISSAGVETVAVEKETYPAKLASEFTPKDYITYELFKSGTAPTETSDRFARLNDVTNLNVSINNLKANLTWDAIATPKYLDTEFLKTYFASVYKSEKDQKKYLNKRIEQNKSKLGNVIYNIYIKNEKGELTNIGSTTGTSFEYQISAGTTFVVKAAYELFAKNYNLDNSSIGTEITASFSANLITSSLKGSSSISINTGEQLIDDGVSVFENGLDVDSSKFTVSKVYYLAEDTNTPITDINTNNVGKYKIKYVVSYGSYSNVLWRDVEIK